MRGHALAAVPQFLGDDVTCCLVRVSFNRTAPTHGGSFPRQLLIAIVGVLMSQTVGRDSVLPCDAAGPHDLIIVILPLVQLSGGIAGAG